MYRGCLGIRFKFIQERSTGLEEIYDDTEKSSDNKPPIDAVGSV